MKFLLDLNWLSKHKQLLEGIENFPVLYRDQVTIRCAVVRNLRIGEKNCDYLIQDNGQKQNLLSAKVQANVYVHFCFSILF